MIPSDRALEAAENLRKRLRVRTHICEDDGTLRGTSLRAAGREVVEAMRDAGKLTFHDLRVRLPHMKKAALHWRLTTLVFRGDVIREGVKGSFLFYLPEER